MRSSTRSLAALLAEEACATVSACVSTDTRMRAKSGFSSASPVPMTLMVGTTGAFCSCARAGAAAIHTRQAATRTMRADKTDMANLSKRKLRPEAEQIRRLMIENRT